MGTKMEFAMLKKNILGESKMFVWGIDKCKQPLF